MAFSTTSSEGGPIYFWREYSSPYDFMSQWYDSPFTAPPPKGAKASGDMTFLTNEQYMMYHKAVVFKDTELADKIMLESKPRAQKALGRKVKNYTDKGWKANRERVVEDGNWWKFTRAKGDSLKMKLLETGNRELVEASPYDRIWGIGYGAENAEGNRGNWGENLLGKALMRVRDRLRREELESKDVVDVGGD